jgi:clan AA aspartic protease (TIGR02281 family)
MGRKTLNLLLNFTTMKKYFLIMALLVAIGAKAQDVIQMEKKGGVYKVPCKINGLALKFVFHTGASDVSISLTEALFMYKNDYLQESDFKGTEYYRIANGDIAEGTKVILKTVEIGKQKLYNVEASVVHSLEAPLLFGQSALQRFGKFTIDYSNNTLIIGGNITATNTIPTAAKPATTQTTTSTSTPNSVTDIDGNVYKTVKIGNQTWMAENLKTTRYANGDVIPNVTDDKEWSNLTSGSFSNYANMSTYDKYGKLYNWFAISDKNSICPANWRVPTFDDFRILIYYLWGEEEAGGKLKSILIWDEPNVSASNSSAFSALPSGRRNINGTFADLFEYSNFWSISELSISSAWHLTLSKFTSKANLFPDDKVAGMSCRCIMN